MQMDGSDELGQSQIALRLLQIVEDLGIGIRDKKNKKKQVFRFEETPLIHGRKDRNQLGISNQCPALRNYTKRLNTVDATSFFKV